MLLYKYLKPKQAIQFISTLFILLLAFSSTLAQEAYNPRPYTLPNTEVHSISSNILKRDYELFIGLPDSYNASEKHYPVLFITDAEYTFALVRNIYTRITYEGKGRDLQEFIVVGLSYSKGDTRDVSRCRDYTPTENKSCAQANKVYGQAEQYAKFISEEVFPFVKKHYRINMSKKIYAGHSYGGLFGTYIMFTNPTMFTHYILSSPSLWFDKHFILNLEKQYAATHKDLPAKVFMLIGELEQIKHNIEHDMVKDMKNFEKILKKRHYPSLSIHSKVVLGEDHLSTFPSSITRGLTWALWNK